MQNDPVDEEILPDFSSQHLQFYTSVVFSDGVWGSFVGLGCLH